MNKTELLSRFASGPEEKLALARVLDKLELARSRNIPACTHFLALGDRLAAGRLIAAAGGGEPLFWGGDEGAVRQVCAVLPDWLDPQDWREGEDCPLSAVAFTAPPGSGLTHRDYLGALMGAGIAREKLGDFLLHGDTCQVVCLRELEPVLLSQVDQIGRWRVKAAPCPLSGLEPPEQKVKAIRDTVATLRLDAVAASGFSTSRAKMADLIAAGKVSLNGRECLKPDRAVEAGDVLSCRGLGKCVLREVLGASKKGRTMILIERFL